MVPKQGAAIFMGIWPLSSSPFYLTTSRMAHPISLWRMRVLKVNVHV